MDPFQAYIGQVNQAANQPPTVASAPLAADPFAQQAAQQGMTAVPPPAPLPVLVGNPYLAQVAAAASPPPPPASPPGAVPTEPAPGSIGPPPPPPPAADPSAHPFLVGGGGIVPAHEVDRRGPTFIRAQNQANATTQQAIAQTEERGQQAAMAEYQMARVQAARAYAREDAAMQSEAERTAELAERQKDFDSTVSQLSQMRMDPDRFWASRSTAQKVSGLIGIALGGFLQGARGGSNPGLDIINQAIDRDIDAQKFAYAATHDTANAKQTAFSMAMQKYQNEDAAKAMARAAALDAVMAETAQVGALHKGTEIGNRADAALAQLQIEKMNQIGQGVAFIPATQRARVFTDPRTGLRYTENEMKGLVAKEGERDFAREQEATKIGGQLMVKGMEQNVRTSDEAQHISAQLQTAGVPQARALAEKALKHLNIDEGGRAEAASRWFLGESLGRMVNSDDANAREQAYADFANAAIKATMGNATENEVVRAQAGLGERGDPASRRRSIANILDVLAGIEKNAKAGASPAAQAEFDRRRAAAEAPNQMPKSFTAHGGK